MTLDLHGVKHKDVPSVLDSFLYENITKKIYQVEIITGKSTTMKKLVKKNILLYGLSINAESDGSYIIFLI